MPVISCNEITYCCAQATGALFDNATNHEGNVTDEIDETPLLFGKRRHRVLFFLSSDVFTMGDFK